MYKRRLYILALILITGFITVHGQEYTLKVNQYGNDQGLDGRNIRSVLRDPNGLVWAAGDQGLYKLDGYNFIQVSQEQIFTTCLDDQGIIWVAGEDGIFKLDHVQQQLIRQSDFNIPHVTKMVFNSGYFWLSDDNRVYKYRPGEPVREIFEFSQLVGLTDALTLEFAVDSPENIWIIQANVAAININENGDVLRYNKGYSNYMSFLKTADGRFWRESFGVFEYQNPGERDFPHQLDTAIYKSLEAKRNDENWSWSESRPQPKEWARLFNQTDKEAVWLFSRNRDLLYKYDLKTKQLSTFDLGNIGLVSPTPLYLDQEGIFWFSSLDGLTSIKIDENPIRKIGYELSSEIELSTRVIYPTAEGNLNFSSYSGLFEIDENDQVRELTDVRVRGKDGRIKTERLQYFLYAALEEEDYIWFSTDSKGLFLFDKSTKTFEQFDYDGHEWGFDLIRDAENTLWVASFGLKKVNEKERILTADEKGALLPEVAIFDFLEAQSGHTWLAGNTGLYLVDLAARKVIKSYEEETLKELRTLFQDDEGGLWIGTVGNGLFRLNPETDSLTNFTMASHGLSDDRIASILAENDSTLWLGSYNGLMRFDTRTHELRSYFDKDGLTHNEFNHGSAYKAPDGRMYFGGVRGINAFYPEELVAPVSESKVLLSQVGIYDPKSGEMIPANNATMAQDQLRLSPGQDFFIVNFTLNDYTDPDNNTFAYRFEGLENNWLDLGKQHSLRLTTPSPGEYSLLIRGRGSNGLWTPSPLVLNIKVLAPFWQRPDFLAAMTLLLIILFYGIIRWRTNSLERAKSQLEKVVKERTTEIAEQRDRLELQAEQLKNLDATKTRFFANISHELRTPLTLIMGHTNQLLEYENAQDYMVQKGLKTTQKNAHNLLSLIEEIMELSKLEAGKIKVESNWVNLLKPVQRIQSIYNTAASQKSIDFKADIALTDSLRVYLDLSKFEKIANNLLSNALKFTPDQGQIILSVSIQNQILIISVKDSGRGIHKQDLPHVFERFYQSEIKEAPTEGGTGIGLSLVHELVQLMGGEIKVQSQLGKGSTFKVSIPVKTETMSISKPHSTEKETETESDLFNGAPAKVGASVLVVEDHAEMRDFICQVLGSTYRLYQAADGKEALTALSKHHIDLVVSDYMMPNMDGMALLTCMKESEAMKNIPVILLTARSDMNDKIKALSIGVDEYMIKPFNPKELIIRSKNLLALKEERQQWLSVLANEQEVPLSEEDTFMNAVRQTIQQQLTNTNFGVIDLAEATATSQRSLTRKLKAYSGLSPLQYITEVRLQEARIMLESDSNSNISEVMHQVGFQTGGHFSRTFQKRFGKTPSEYANNRDSNI